jgi:peptidoglycan/LPS O-acetylase OafA/YrhL
MVTMHHAVASSYSNEADYWSRNRTEWGAFGVDIFFGLSGILITSLLVRGWEEGGSISLKAFYRRRALRIMPAYFTFLATVTALGMWRSDREVWSCLLFWRNYLPSPAGSVTTPLWSLAVEEHFYLLWPSMLVLVRRKYATNVAAGAAMAVGIWRMIESAAGWDLFAGVPAHFRTDLRLDCLLWGCAVALVMRENPTCLTRPGSWVWFAVAAVGILCGAYYSQVGSVVLGFVIPTILAATLLHPKWTVCRLLDSAPLVWIGRISYGLYLWQGLLLLPGWEKLTYQWQRFPANLVVLAGVAIASYYLIERPVRRLGIAARRRSPIAGDAETVLLPGASPESSWP